ncbi:hypothetical protein DICVIV_02259 [Dictyocaulus viviparus]|uniref:Uncharacterized protein n=1 Tax=Dictyocaulus viviparus TaxID=29172 RepID=A0A0D8Y5P9_DICVI|nr:hypothetical protein DICVIV_02259 [Dictyocaulus viviparus]
MENNASNRSIRKINGRLQVYGKYVGLDIGQYSFRNARFQINVKLTGPLNLMKSVGAAMEHSQAFGIH